jgi:hypothetical protein
LVSPRRLTNAEADKRSVDCGGCAAASYLTRLQLSWGVRRMRIPADTFY